MSFRLKNMIRELKDEIDYFESSNSNLNIDLSNAESKIKSLNSQVKLLEDRNNELIDELMIRNNQVNKIKDILTEFYENDIQDLIKRYELYEHKELLSLLISKYKNTDNIAQIDNIIQNIELVIDHIIKLS